MVSVKPIAQAPQVAKFTLRTNFDAYIYIYFTKSPLMVVPTNLPEMIYFYLYIYNINNSFLGSDNALCVQT